MLLNGATDIEIAKAMADVMKQCYEHHSLVTNFVSEYLDEDMDFTFEDFEMPETFNLLAGME